MAWPGFSPSPSKNLLGRRFHGSETSFPAALRNFLHLLQASIHTQFGKKPTKGEQEGLVFSLEDGAGLEGSQEWVGLPWAIRDG